MRNLRGAVVEIHKDDEPLFRGTHKGASRNMCLRDPGAKFLSLGVPKSPINYDEIPGGNDEYLLIKNITQGYDTYVWISPQDGNDGDDQCTTAFFDWNIGDVYEIYKTKVYNSTISSIYTDRIYGNKVNHPEELHKGYLVDDVDLDEDRKHVFGPGQPFRPERY